MSTYLKYLFAITAFSPILLTYAFVSFLNGYYWLTAGVSLVFGIVVIIVHFIIRSIGNQLKTKQFKTKTVETKDGESLSFLLVYLLPLITGDLAEINWLLWILFTLLICLVLATNYGFYFNPLLFILQFHFYKIAEEDGIPHVLITKRRINRTGETLETGKLAEYVLIEKKVPS